MAEISVIMPVYNAEKYLIEAVSSILNQDHQDLEFIIINDDSNDETAHLLSIYSRFDERIVLINNKKRMGVAVSLNRGLQSARGKYIARMDGDDISELNRLSRQKAYLDSHPEVALVGTWASIIDHVNNMRWLHQHLCDHEDIYRVSIGYNPFTHGSIMVRAEVFNETSTAGYNPFFETAEDYDFFLRVMEKYRVYNLPEYLYRYRLHQGSVGSKRAEMQKEKAELIRINAIKRRGLDYQDALLFSESWPRRCFYYNYGKLLKGKEVLIFAGSETCPRNIAFLESLGCRVKGLIISVLTEIGGNLQGYRFYELKDLKEMEEVMIVIDSHYWKEKRDVLTAEFNIARERIIYSFYI